MVKELFPPVGRDLIYVRRLRRELKFVVLLFDLRMLKRRELEGATVT
jgi:hypothetical protein